MVKNNKTPEVAEALKNLKDYLKEYNLDPCKDWTKDPIHGKKVTKLITKLNLERDKLTIQYPLRDLKNEVKLIKLKQMKKAKKEAEKKAKDLVKKTEGKAAKKEEPKKKAAAKSTKTKYDYPLIDGREMTSDEKKKYRMEQRKLAAGKTPKPKKEKEEKVTKKAKPAKEAKAEKPAKAKKAKKAKKEED